MFTLRLYSDAGFAVLLLTLLGAPVDIGRDSKVKESTQDARCSETYLHEHLRSLVCVQPVMRVFVSICDMRSVVLHWRSIVQERSQSNAFLLDRAHSPLPL